MRQQTLFERFCAGPRAFFGDAMLEAFAGYGMMTALLKLLVALGLLHGGAR